MKRETYISIPQPCRENWDAMTPQDKGRFCASCAKTVVDFSQMSDTQVLNYLSQATGRLCGRFAQDQVERPLEPIKKEKKKIWWMAALMPLTLLLNKANAQKLEKNAIKTEYTEYNKYAGTVGLVAVKRFNVGDTILKTSNKLITGTLVDKDSIPIIGASVVLKGTNIVGITDSNGVFQLSFSTDSSSVTLIVTLVGFEEKEFNCTLKDTDEVNIGIQSLTWTPVLLGDVVIAGGITAYCPANKIDTIKTTVRKILHTNPFKAYPNPVRRGTPIQIEVKRAGHYSIQLLDVHSSLIAHRLFDAVKGAYTTAITIPSSAAAGVYFIRLINDDTKQQYTDKIIVQ